MSSLPLHSYKAEAKKRPQPAQVLTGSERGTLNALRMVAMACRSAARTDLFQACALLSGERSVAQDAHARALTRGLHQALGRRPLFYRSGEVDVTFDEAWIIRAISASRTGDFDSFQFLLRSRIAKPYRRQIAFLVHAIAERFCQD
ncbi:hypothetical protein PSJ8397_02680 [Pseudooctadecabacter jejudonensis]|uniref:Uncharacterized protein n=1 Tax=Pseudooctadecabacter jejudonensis TaxID=1391910 RepID=A0A1Y5T363_9RHOB|nr:hypothetical protein PSJ8397_02680 [Pseudooctadecabacter jejudonensis]